MSQEFEGQDPLVLAHQAERDLNSNQAKQGSNTSDSSKNPILIASNTILIAAFVDNESGVDTGVTNRFPGSTVQVGSSSTGREIPVEEGGEISAEGRSASEILVQLRGQC